MNALLEMFDVSRRYGEEPNHVDALVGIDLQVAPGEVVAIMGPSGSGKSTLLTIAGGLETTTTGEVLLDGVNLSGLSAADLAAVRRRQVGFVFQEFNLISGLTAAENVAAPLELDGTSHREALGQAREHLAAVGLGDRGSAFPADLSGGERQRVAIARALVGDRRLLLADEPTGALDSQSGEQVMSLLTQACADDVAVVVVTHDSEIAEHAQRIVSIRDGRIVDERSGGAKGSTASRAVSVEAHR